MKKLSLTAVMLAMIATGSHNAQADISDLNPTQLVRSFQRVQDSIALGDTAAIGMQRELYKLVRGELSRPGSGEVANERNLRAILSFAISGGGVALVYARRDAFNEFPELHMVARAVQRFNGKNAPEVFAQLNPREIGGILGSTIALVRSQQGDDLDGRIADLKYVKLQLPGTIFEESALRAILAVYRQRGDRQNFLREASRYARAFPTSPYNRTFANEMVRAAVDMDDAGFRSGIMDVLSLLPEREGQALTARIKRAASIAGKRELFFALEENENSDGPDAAEMMSDADRRLLHIYNQIESLTVETANEALSEVRNIIPSDLQAKNRRLRSVVLAMLNAIVAEPVIDEQAKTASVDPGPENIIEPAAGAETEAPAAEAPAAELPASELPVAQTAAAGTPEAEDELKIDSFVEEMRSKIGGADEFLEGLE